jgi:cellobiose epimerase
MKPILIFSLLLLTQYLTAQVNTSTEAGMAEKIRIADSMEQSLQRDLLDRYYPQALDTAFGGFLSTFSYEMKPTGIQNKMIVTQARHTWVNAKASIRYPNIAYYRMGITVGYHFLADKMWDKEYGGFFNLLTRDGKIPKTNLAFKEAYGNAFAIYALSACFEATGDTNAISLAKKAFIWLEIHSHDVLHKGYFQHLERNGTPVHRTAQTPSIAETGYKDQNSSIHILEAFTALYEVWKDELLKKRLQEMFLLIRDRIVSPRGNLTLFFDPDWTPVSILDSGRNYILKHHNLDYVSFGHDVETAYLLLEASHVLGLQNDTTTLRISKQMVDHALRNGWDNQLGGFYDEGFYFKGDSSITILKESKNWWAQAEGMNSLLMLADYFPNDPMQYFDKFKMLWKYTQTYLIDHTYGDWYEEGLDKEPQRKTALKGHIWKATYHNYRALSNCVDRLRKKSF